MWATHLTLVAVLAASSNVLGAVEGYQGAREKPVSANRGAGIAKISEEALRRIATRREMPKYPSTSLKRGLQGPVVVSVVVNPEGLMESVSVLQTPDAEIGQAVREAVTKWTFAPATIEHTGERTKLIGKLTFYYRISKGVGTVLNPEEAVNR